MEQVVADYLAEMYYLGYEHASDDMPCQQWFKSELEKEVYISGYNDFVYGNTNVDVQQEIERISKLVRL